MQNAGSIQQNIDVFLDELADLAIDSFLKHVSPGSMLEKNSPTGGSHFNGRLGHQASCLVSSTGTAI